MSSLLYENLIKPHLYNDNIFLIHDDETTTSYKDFICLASQIAHQLSELGLNAGDCLIVKSPKSEETLALYIASILTGSIYLPLNSFLVFLKFYNCNSVPSDHSICLIGQTHIHIHYGFEYL